MGLEGQVMWNGKQWMHIIIFYYQKSSRRQCIIDELEVMDGPSREKKFQQTIDSLQLSRCQNPRIVCSEVHWKETHQMNEQRLMRNTYNPAGNVVNREEALQGRNLVLRENREVSQPLSPLAGRIEFFLDEGSDGVAFQGCGIPSLSASTPTMVKQSFSRVYSRVWPCSLTQPSSGQRQNISINVIASKNSEEQAAAAVENLMNEAKQEVWPYRGRCFCPYSDKSPLSSSKALTFFVERRWAFCCKRKGDPSASICEGQPSVLCC